MLKKTKTERDCSNAALATPMVNNIGVSYISRETPMENRPSIRTKEDLRTMYPECFTEGPENHFPDYQYHITLNPEATGKIDTCPTTTTVRNTRTDQERA